MYATIAKASELHAVAVRDTRLKRKPANEQRVAKVQGSAEGLREARASKNKDNGPFSSGPRRRKKEALPVAPPQIASPGPARRQRLWLAKRLHLLLVILNLISLITRDGIE